MTQRLSPDPDLDALIRKLNAAARTVEAQEAAPMPEEPGIPGSAAVVPAPAAVTPRFVLSGPTEQGEQWLARLLGDARSRHASDLLFVAGAPPVARVDGRLTPLSDAVLSGAATGMLCGVLAPPARRAGLEASGTADFALVRNGVGRLRCNIHRERDHWAAAVHLLPTTALDLEALQLPPALARFADLEYGLVLVTGPTGSGKSTTLAALMKRILARRRVHAITIEDPVEYEHKHEGSVVEHVEIGRDASTFAGALRSALRQDPDVLLIGEMRDPESASIAITAAETGHLVLSTLHTGDAPQTIHRILDTYPANQMEMVRVQLSVSLAGIVSQQLLPRKDGAGRVPAVEVMLATHAVRNLIRQGKIAMLRSQITLERASGMLGLDQSLARLCRSGLVDVGEARARARQPEEFDQLVHREDAG